MKKCVLIVLAMTTVLLVGTGFKFNEAVAADYDPAGPQCTSNCFWGYVYEKLNGQNVPVQGVTVELFYQEPTVPPVWTSCGTRQTDNQGKYCFCKPMGGWTSGSYLIKTGCCQKAEYRQGDGDIQVDFYGPCPCYGPPKPREPNDLPREPIWEP